MKVVCSIEADLIVLHSIPEVIFVNNPFMNLEVVNSGIDYDFFKNLIVVSVRSNAIFKSCSLNLGIVMQAGSLSSRY